MQKCTWSHYCVFCTPTHSQLVTLKSLSSSLNSLPYPNFTGKLFFFPPFFFPPFFLPSRYWSTFLINHHHLHWGRSGDTASVCLCVCARTYTRVCLSQSIYLHPIFHINMLIEVLVVKDISMLAILVVCMQHLICSLTGTWYSLGNPHQQLKLINFILFQMFSSKA